MKKLPLHFYRRDDVQQIARDLLGKLIVTRFDRKLTIARIVETEAYAGIGDRASHAYGGRRTRRNEVMYAAGGQSYIYLCYGLHHLFNVVTHGQGIPHAVLIRGAEPVSGIKHMLSRTGKTKADHTLTRGPGNLSRALGIHTEHTGCSLLGTTLYLAGDDYAVDKSLIVSSPRIGVDYAGADALLPYRYFILGNRFVSGNNRTISH